MSFFVRRVFLRRPFLRFLPGLSDGVKTVFQENFSKSCTAFYTTNGEQCQSAVAGCCNLVLLTAQAA